MSAILGKRVEYAFIAINYLADLPKDQFSTCQDIAERYIIPFSILAKVMQNLKKSGIIHSMQGVKGGYHLERALNDISVGEVIESINGKMNSLECLSEDGDCERFSVCNIVSKVSRFDGLLMNFLYNIDMKEFRISEDAYKSKIEHEGVK